MSTDELIIKFPAGLENAIQLTKIEFELQLRLMAALKMFELGKISSGKAAELAGLSRIEFFEVCGKYHVCAFNYSPDEVEAEIAADLRNLKK